MCSEGCFGVEASSTALRNKKLQTLHAAAVEMYSEGCFSVEASSTALRNKNSKLYTRQPRTCAARAALAWKPRQQL
jgi:hypothetical protein